MSNPERLIRKFLFKQSAITIVDVRRLLEGFDYTEGKNPGSECIFHKRRSNPINVPTVKGRYVKKYYVKRIVKILELEEYLENFKGD